MNKFQQEDIITRTGRIDRFQVMPLDEEDKPAEYYGSDKSPADRYALVDRLNHLILATMTADCYQEARERLMSKYVNNH